MEKLSRSNLGGGWDPSGAQYGVHDGGRTLKSTLRDTLRGASRGTLRGALRGALRGVFRGALGGNLRDDLVLLSP